MLENKEIFMKAVGLITEYNPFHNGHKYHIEKSKELTGADYVIVVMSGNYVQRGTPAIIDKYTRTEMALKMGADMVFELPVSFACASAEFFAYGAVSILDRLGFVDSICFGSEAGTITELNPIADLLFEESEEYRQSLNSYLKQGNSFPTARAAALKDYISLNHDQFPTLAHLSEKELENILYSSNNILGIEYLKALKQLQSPMIPYTIKREGASYSDKTFSKEQTFSSATAIRSILEMEKKADSLTSDTFTEIFTQLEQAMPKEVLSILKPLYQKTFPIQENDFSDMLYYKLKTTPLELLSNYGDVSTELSCRIKNQLSSYENYKQFAMELKTKQYTLTRINRCLLHILLELPDPQKELSYARLLGFRKNASHLLKQIPEDSFPLITKMAHGNTLLSGKARQQFDHEILCNDLYNYVVYAKYGTKIASDYTHPLVIL